MTSHDCVARVRRLLQLKRVGHGGTLDPLATGVLPIALGNATRLLQYLPQDKAYRATIRFGITTTTDDLAGEILRIAPRAIQRQEIEQILPEFLGQIQQLPPSYSAIQVQGQRLYDLARQGKAIAVAARTVEVKHMQILDWRSQEFPELDLAIACGPGTYIRAIARDLGMRLGCGGTLAALVRTASSGFSLEESLSFAELEAQIQTHRFTPLAAAVALKHLPAIDLSGELAQRWCWGQKLPLALDQVGATGYYRIYDPAGTFLGVGQHLEGLLVPKVVLPGM